MTNSQGRPSTSDVLLRDVAEGDLPILFEQQLDPDACRMAAFPSRDREAFMAHWRKILRDESTKNKTILFGGQIAGYIAHFVIGDEPLVGYWIGKEYWGQGIAPRALQSFLPLVKTRPLYARVVKHNVASIRVLEKCGFTMYGVEKEASQTGGEEIEELILRLESWDAGEVR